MTNTPSALGAWIRNNRRAASMTQIELSRIMEKTQATISRWETGQEAVLITDIEKMFSLFSKKGLNPEAPPGLHARPEEKTPVMGLIKEGGEIKEYARPQGYVTSPIGTRYRSLSAFRIATTALMPLGEGWLVFAENLDATHKISDAVDRLAIVREPDGPAHLGWFRRLGRGRYGVENLSRPLLTMETPACAVPVVAIIPPDEPL